jgi:hypothetical protein
MTTTKNLNIPLLDGSQPLLTQQFNGALDAVDKNALPITHAATKAHWDMWQPGTVYGKQEVFRTTTIPSWGFWEVTAAGKSGNTEPVGYGEGDTYTDGTAVLTLRKIGGKDIGNHLGETMDGDLTYKDTVVYKDTRTIIFVGTFWPIVYPYKGTIQKLTVLCSVPLTTAADFTVQKISSKDYAAGGSWDILGAGTYTIATDKSYMEWDMAASNAIAAGDIVRISSEAKNLDATVFHLYCKNY